MKTIEVTIKLVLQVPDDVAQDMIDAPGFISLNGMCLGEEDQKVGQGH